MNALRRAQKFMRRLALAARSVVDDAVVLAGAALLAHGLSIYSPPLGPITFGFALIAFVALGGERPQRRR